MKPRSPHQLVALLLVPSLVAEPSLAALRDAFNVPRVALGTTGYDPSGFASQALEQPSVPTLTPVLSSQPTAEMDQELKQALDQKVTPDDTRHSGQTPDPDLLQRLDDFLKQNLEGWNSDANALKGIAMDPFKAVKYRYGDPGFVLRSGSLANFLRDLFKLAEHEELPEQIQALAEELADPVRREAVREAWRKRRVQKSALTPFFTFLKSYGFETNREAVNFEAMAAHPMAEIARLEAAGHLRRVSTFPLGQTFFAELGQLLTGQPLQPLLEAPKSAEPETEPTVADVHQETAGHAQEDTEIIPNASGNHTADRRAKTVFPQGVIEKTSVLWGEDPANRRLRKILSLTPEQDGQSLNVTVGLSETAGVTIYPKLTPAELCRRVQGLTLPQAERTLDRVAGRLPLWQPIIPEPPSDDPWLAFLEAVSELAPAWQVLHKEPRTLSAWGLWEALPKQDRRGHLRTVPSLVKLMDFLCNQYLFPLQRKGSGWRARGLALVPAVTPERWSRWVGRRWQATQSRKTMKVIAIRAKAVLYGYWVQLGERLPAEVDRLKRETGLGAKELEGLLQEWERLDRKPENQREILQIEQVAKILGIDSDRLAAASVEAMMSTLPSGPQPSPEPEPPIPVDEAKSEPILVLESRPLIDKLLGEERFPFRRATDYQLKNMLQELDPAFILLQTSRRPVGAPELWASLDVPSTVFATTVHYLIMCLQQLLEEVLIPLQRSPAGWRTTGLARLQNFYYPFWPGGVLDNREAIGPGQNLSTVIRRVRLYLQAYHRQLGDHLVPAIDNLKIRNLSAENLAALCEQWQALDRPPANRQEVQQIQEIADLLSVEVDDLAGTSIADMLEKLPEQFEPRGNAMRTLEQLAFPVAHWLSPRRYKNNDDGHLLYRLRVAPPLEEILRAVSGTFFSVLAIELGNLGHWAPVHAAEALLVAQAIPWAIFVFDHPRADIGEASNLGFFNHVFLAGATLATLALLAIKHFIEPEKQLMLFVIWIVMVVGVVGRNIRSHIKANYKVLGLKDTHPAFGDKDYPFLLQNDKERKNLLMDWLEEEYPDADVMTVDASNAFWASSMQSDDVVYLFRSGINRLTAGLLAKKLAGDVIGRLATDTTRGLLPRELEALAPDIALALEESLLPVKPYVSGQKSGLLAVRIRLSQESIQFRIVFESTEKRVNWPHRPGALFENSSLNLQADLVVSTYKYLGHSLTLDWPLQKVHARKSVMFWVAISAGGLAALGLICWLMGWKFAFLASIGLGGLAYQLLGKIALGRQELNRRQEAERAA